MTKQTKTDNPPVVKHRFHLHKPFLIGLGIFLVLAGAATTYAFYYADRYLPHTVVSGVEIGGMNRAEAEAAVQTKVQHFLETPQHLTFGESAWDFAPQDLGSSFDVTDTLNHIWEEEKGSGWKHQLKELVVAPFASMREDLGYALSTEAGEAKLHETILKNIEVPHHETDLKFVPGKVEVVAGKAGKRLDRTQFETNFYQAFKNGGSGFALSLQDFEPEVSAEMAEAARVQASAILDGGWELSRTGAGAIVVDAPTVAGWLSTSVARSNGVATGLKLELSASKVDAAIAEWRKTTDQKPTNARLVATNGVITVSEDSKDGLALSADQTKQKISDALFAYTGGARSFAAVIDVSRPAVRRDTFESLGLTSVIGTATTDFSGSPTNRKINIALGQRNLNGTLLMPGEVYSTIETMGPIDEASGFLAELVIKDNRTVPEAGGGLCQVSTTLFRAVLNAGMPIVERSNHSYRVSYYERSVGPGLDATIYDPKPDFRWKNDLGKPVYIASRVKGNTITFELYGTSDGRVSTIGAPQILEESPPGDPIYSNTDTLYVGQTKQVETAHPGAKTAVNYTVTRDGKEIYKQIFRSTYKPWPAQYLIGTKPLETPVTP